MGHLSKKRRGSGGASIPMRRKLQQAVVLAGGLGTRLRPLTDRLPKPMLPFHGKPFACYLVEMLRDAGIREVLFLLGYLPEAVVNYFGDGKKWGLSIRYSIQPVEAETGTRLRVAADLLDDSFLLLYCDNYWPLQIKEMLNFWEAKSSDAMLTVYANEDGWTKDNLSVSEDGFISVYDKSRSLPGLKGVDIGFGFFQKKHVLGLPEGNVSFEKEVYPALVAERQLAGYISRHRYYSIGSLARLEETEKFLRFSKVCFLDRDGVLNKKAAAGEYIESPEKFEWLPGTLEALRRLHDAGFRIAVITNQAGVARGKLSMGMLEAIHEKMRREAEEAGGKIDLVCVCPHHWEEKCDCRKPNPGLFFLAQKELHCDLSRVTFIGDQESDQIAAERAGCRVIKKTSEQSLLEIAERIIDS